MNNETSVIVIGGGLAGLTAATFVAKRGCKVTLLERSASLGGRGASVRHDGWTVNLGPHALYRGGAALPILRELGVRPSGRTPPSSGNLAACHGAVHTLPGGPLSLLSTSLLSSAGKLEGLRLLGLHLWAPTSRIPEDASVESWVEQRMATEDGRRLAYALFRVTTYMGAPERMSARACVTQLQRAVLRSVLYLHGGWQTIVDGLRRAADAAGVVIERGAQATEIVHDETVRAVRLFDGRSLPADAAIIAASPSAAAQLVPRSRALASLRDASMPLRAAALDVCLTSLPNPRARFVLGIDRPVYLSVHSLVASLAPPGAASIQLLRYGPDLEDSDEAELEALLETHQPGWRDHVAWRRFLPRITVSNAVVEPGKCRPGPAVPGVRGLFVAGDWVGDEGMLVDAALASAKRAAERVSEELNERAELDRRGILSVA